MFINQIVLLIIICLVAFTYLKGYSLKSRLVILGIAFTISLLLALPILQLSMLTLIGLFIIERIWLLLALVFFIDMVLSKNNRIFKIVSILLSIVLYLFLRRMI